MTNLYFLGVMRWWVTICWMIEICLHADICVCVARLLTFFHRTTVWVLTNDNVWEARRARGGGWCGVGDDWMVEEAEVQRGF